MNRIETFRVLWIRRTHLRTATFVMGTDEGLGATDVGALTPWADHGVAEDIVDTGLRFYDQKSLDTVVSAIRQKLMGFRSAGSFRCVPIQMLAYSVEDTVAFATHRPSVGVRLRQALDGLGMVHTPRWTYGEIVRFFSTSSPAYGQK